MEIHTSGTGTRQKSWKESKIDCVKEKKEGFLRLVVPFLVRVQ